MRKIALILAVATMVGLWGFGFASDIPHTMSYQGRLTNDGTGEPISGTFNLTFKLYSCADCFDAPALLWEEYHAGVTLDAGLFSVELGGTGNPIPPTVFAEPDIWVGITLGTDPEFAPRVKLTAAAYSFKALHADTAAYAAGGPGVADDDWIVFGSDVYREGGNVGIGNSAPLERLTIGPNYSDFYGDFITIRNNDSTTGIMFGQDYLNRFVLERHTDGEIGMYSYESGSFYSPLTLVRNRVAIASSGWTPSEPLVVGKDLGAFSGDRIVVGDSNPGTQTGLVFGEAGSDRGWLLWDVDDDLVTIGSRHEGTNYSNALTVQQGHVGVGIEPSAITALRVDREHNTSVARYGIANDTKNTGTGAIYGIWSKADRQTSASPGLNQVQGVYGYATTLGGGTVKGVAGYASGGDLTIGIYGATGSSDPAYEYAGYFDGDVNVLGLLYGGGVVSRIDHPLDPANKYLQHASVESPDMMNVYNGNVILGADGSAVVELPDWFEPLNRDFRYQLTCIGGFAPVYIAQKISDNRFVIAGGTSGLEVSWQVTGIRQDPWAEDNRLQVEVDKGSFDQGLYRYPEGYGMGADRGVAAKVRGQDDEAAVAAQQ